MKNVWTFMYKYFVLYYLTILFLGERFTNLSDYRGLIEVLVQIFVVVLLFMEEKKNNENVYPK